MLTIKRHLTALGMAMMLASQTAWAAPKIACPEPEFKFGEKESGLNVEASFVIRNEGDQPLQIGKVLPGCGCTSAKEQKRGRS